MKCQQVQYHQCQQHDWQGHDMQCKEAVKSDSGDQVVAANPGNDVVTDHGDRAKQGDNHLCTPVGHLAPGQHIAYKSLCHQHHEDQHPEDPDQFPGFLVGAVNQGAKHMQVDHHEERRGSGGVHIAQYPAEIDIAHDVFNRCEGALLAGGVAHGQPDTGQQLVDQHHQ